MKTAYIGGIILDGTKDMEPQRGKTVIVENGRIAEIRPAGELLPSDCEIVNLQGCYLMPGLINLHVHLNSDGKPSGKKPKGSSSEEATAALKTVEPSTYAGQTVYGKVTAINDSQITVTLGTYNKEASVTQTSAATEETELTDAVATTTDQNADPTAESAHAGTKKKKSRFTASDEQMIITIPESLAGIEIKEKYVLAITLDDSGSVTALEVASKGHSKSKSASNGEKGAGQEKAPGTGDNAELNTDETTDL